MKIFGASGYLSLCMEFRFGWYFLLNGFPSELYSILWLHFPVVTQSVFADLCLEEKYVIGVITVSEEPK